MNIKSIAYSGANSVTHDFRVLDVHRVKNTDDASGQLKVEELRCNPCVYREIPVEMKKQVME